MITYLVDMLVCLGDIIYTREIRRHPTDKDPLHKNCALVSISVCMDESGVQHSQFMLSAVLFNVSGQPSPHLLSSYMSRLNHFTSY